MAPKVVLHRRIASLPLIDALPGGQLLDLTAFAHIDGPAVSGIFKNLGTEPAFEVTYPVDKIKYVIDGRASIIEDGQNITATAGDAIFFPASSVFTILQTVFTAF